jgi:hypothetical protein
MVAAFKKNANSESLPGAWVVELRIFRGASETRSPGTGHESRCNQNHTYPHWFDLMIAWFKTADILSQRSKAVLARCVTIFLLELLLWVNIQLDLSTDWIRTTLMVLCDFLPVVATASMLRCWLWGIPNTRKLSNCGFKFTFYLSYIVFAIMYGFAILGIAHQIQIWALCTWNLWSNAISLIVFDLSLFELLSDTIHVQKELQKLKSMVLEESTPEYIADSNENEKKVAIPIILQEYLKDGPIFAAASAIPLAGCLGSLFLNFNRYQVIEMVWDRFQWNFLFAHTNCLLSGLLPAGLYVFVHSSVQHKEYAPHLWSSYLTKAWVAATLLSWIYSIACHAALWMHGGSRLVYALFSSIACCLFSTPGLVDVGRLRTWPHDLDKFFSDIRESICGELEPT